MTHPEKYWPEANEEHCCHPDCGFVGQFQTAKEKYDFYVFDNHGPDDQQVCLRYGPNPEDYYSPGSLLSFLTSTMYVEKFKGAVDLLAGRGFLTYVLSKELK